MLQHRGSNAHSQSTNLTSKSRPYTKQTSIQYVDFKNPTASSECKRKDSADFYLSSLLRTLGLASEISRLLLKTDLLQQDRKNRDGNYSTIPSCFYNYCSLLEHAVTSYNMSTHCCNRIPHLSGNRSSKIIMNVCKSIGSVK